MFGKNQILKQDLRFSASLAVKEIFPTIQGEGPLAGVPAIFIRLAGCNLACHFCDTDFEGGNILTVEAIVKECEQLRGRQQISAAIITGGEPFRQDITLLIQYLREAGFNEVQIETAGTLWIPWFMDLGAKIVVSPKTPRLHPAIYDNADAWKYIVKAGEVCDVDGLPIRSTQVLGKESRIARPPLKTSLRDIYIQPMDEQDSTMNARNTQQAIEVCMKFGYRLCVQVHKVVGLP